MRYWRCGMLSLAVASLLTISSGAVLAGPPKVGAPSPFAQWLAPLNPASWEMPEWNWPGRQKKSPPVLRRKSDGVWNGMTSAVSQGWQKTKRTLDPGNWKSQPEPQSKVSRSRSEEKPAGFWAGLWPKRDEPKKVETINDFLSQPVPY